MPPAPGDDGLLLQLAALLQLPSESTIQLPLVCAKSAREAASGRIIDAQMRRRTFEPILVIVLEDTGIAEIRVRKSRLLHQRCDSSGRKLIIAGIIVVCDAFANLDDREHAAHAVGPGDPTAVAVKMNRMAVHAEVGEAKPHALA